VRVRTGRFGQVTSFAGCRTCWISLRRNLWEYWTVWMKPVASQLRQVPHLHRSCTTTRISLVTSASRSPSVATQHSSLITTLERSSTRCFFPLTALTCAQWYTLRCFCPCKLLMQVSYRCVSWKDIFPAGRSGGHHSCSWLHRVHAGSGIHHYRCSDATTGVNVH
jgi:hypothetical protein